MGDVLTLVEKAQEKFDADEMQASLMQGDFNFESFLQMQGMMGKLGDFSSIFNMMGMKGMLNQFGVNLNKETQDKMLAQGETKMKKFKSAIQSMTKKERANPNLINMGRRTRIAKGSGQKLGDVDKLINEFYQMKKMMDKFKPLMGMMQGQSNLQGDFLKNLMPNQQSGLRPQSGLSKGFKPKKKNP